MNNLSKDDIRPLVTNLAQKYDILIGITDPPSYYTLFSSDKTRLLPNVNFLFTENIKQDLLKNTVTTINSLGALLDTPLLPKKRDEIKQAFNYSCNFFVAFFFQQIEPNFRFNAPSEKLKELNISAEDKEFLIDYMDALMTNFHITPHLPDAALKQIAHMQKYFLSQEMENEPVSVVQKNNEMILHSPSLDRFSQKYLNLHYTHFKNVLKYSIELYKNVIFEEINKIDTKYENIMENIYISTIKNNQDLLGAKYSLHNNEAHTPPSYSYNMEFINFLNHNKSLDDHNKKALNFLYVDNSHLNSLLGYEKTSPILDKDNVIIFNNNDLLVDLQAIRLSPSSTVELNELIGQIENAKDLPIKVSYLGPNDKITKNPVYAEKLRISPAQALSDNDLEQDYLIVINTIQEALKKSIKTQNSNDPQYQLIITSKDSNEETILLTNSNISFDFNKDKQNPVHIIDNINQAKEVFKSTQIITQDLIEKVSRKNSM